MPLINDDLVTFNKNLDNQKNATGAAGDAADIMGQTVSSQISQIVNNITTLVRGLDQVLGPAIKGLLDLINSVLTAATAAVAKLTEMFQMNRARTQAREELGGVMGRGTRKADPAAVEARAQEIFEASQASAAAAAAATSTQPPANQILPTGLLTGGQQKVEPVAKQQQQFEALLLKKKQEGLLLAANTKEERAQLELVIEKFNLNRQFPDLKDSELEKMREQLQANFDLGAAERKRAADAKAADDAKEAALKRQQAEAQRLQQLFGGIGQTISTGIVDALMDAQNATQALGGMLQSVAKQMMQLGINSLLKAAFPGSALFGGLLGFANGGRPPVGRPSVVGERGPELFVPDRAGTILPNGVGMGGTTITVNVDASETSADASSGSGAQLGKAIGLAVQQELLKQKRPGGLLAGV